MSDFDRWQATNNAGITPPSEYILDYFRKVYIESLKELDLIALWNSSDPEEVAISKHFCPNANFINGLVALEPYYHFHPWSEALREKKVLVIHPFEDSIKEQYSKENCFSKTVEFYLSLSLLL